MADMRLTRLKIDNYRNVAPGTELHFSDKFNALLGKNGTGKTTLLKLIAMVVADGLAPLREQRFDLTYTLAFADADLDVHVQNSRLRVKTLEPHFAWSYEITFKAHDDPALYQITAKSTPPLLAYSIDGSVVPASTLSLTSPFEGKFLSDALSLLSGADIPAQRTLAGTSLKMRRNAARGRFDETLGGFEAMTDTDHQPALGGPPSARVAFLRSKDGASLGYWSMFVPEGLSEKIDEHDRDPPETIRLTGADLPYLHKSVEIMEFSAAEMLLRRRGKQIDEFDGGESIIYGGFEFNFTLDDGEIIRHDELSYGQKRLLSFFYYAAANPDIIIADELVNGMHHAWVEACLNEIVERQSFLTSQNPLLLDFLFFDSVKEVEESFILCTMEKHDGRGHFVWKNLTPESAARFYRAYEAGIQHVSEILATKGLW
jgi:energy-coupling factor transporter ATP-binding protein EcfA2